MIRNERKCSILVLTFELTNANGATANFFQFHDIHKKYLKTLKEILVFILYPLLRNLARL